MRKFIPDDVSLGAQLFFLAQTQIQAKQPQDAHRSLVECASTHWVDKKHNAYILQFSLAKLFQSQGMHEDAIGAFNKAIDMYPKNSHTFFRRAWSYKVRAVFFFFVFSWSPIIHRMRFFHRLLEIL